MRVEAYDCGGFHDEMFDSSGAVRAEAAMLLETIESLEDGQLQRCQRAAESLLVQMGITFNVYGDSAGTERIFPFDLIPRIVSGDEWTRLERGLKQRIHALNAFIDDIYHDQKILKDKIIPEEVIRSATFYRPQCRRHQSAAKASGATSPAPTWYVTATARSTFSKTICACRPAFPTSWRIAT